MKRQEWRRRLIQLSLNGGGKRRCLALVHKGLAVLRSPYDACIQITHVRTGFRVGGGFPSIEAAQACVIALTRRPAIWKRIKIHDRETGGFKSGVSFRDFVFVVGELRKAKGARPLTDAEAKKNYAIARAGWGM